MNCGQRYLQDTIKVKIVATMMEAPLIFFTMSCTNNTSKKTLIACYLQVQATLGHSLQKHCSPGTQVPLQKNQKCMYIPVLSLTKITKYLGGDLEEAHISFPLASFVWKFKFLKLMISLGFSSDRDGPLGEQGMKLGCATLEDGQNLTHQLPLCDCVISFPSLSRWVLTAVKISEYI